MPRYLTLLAIGLVAEFCAWIVPASVRAAELPQFTQTQVHMGVEVQIVVCAADQVTADSAFAAAFERIAELDKRLSDYSLSSELSLLSAAAPTTEPVKLSDDLFTVLQASQQLAAESDGAFDVTIGPLTKLWRRARRQNEVPGADLLKTAFAAVGHRALQIDAANKTASLTRPGMRLDLGGIAKGYAADQALAVLKQKGCPQSLVRASGDIAVGDPPDGQIGWRVHLAPLNPEDPPTVFLALKQQAISTSGEARQHLTVNGRRYSHLIDPRTGEPLHGRMSVTIIAPRGIDADSLASAVAVLGPEKGLKLLGGRPGTSAYLVTANDDGSNIHTFSSANFPAIAK